MVPAGDEVIYPYDKLLAVGTAAQLAEFRADMAGSIHKAEESGEFELEPVVLTDSSWLTGKTLRETDMRSTGCMVISVISGGETITNPKPDYLFKAGDTVWLAGEKSACSWWT